MYSLITTDTCKYLLIARPKSQFVNQIGCNSYLFPCCISTDKIFCVCCSDAMYVILQLAQNQLFKTGQRCNNKYKTHMYVLNSKLLNRERQKTPVYQKHMGNTFSFLAFSYFSLSLCPFKELLAAKNTYLNSFGLIGSFQKASHVTVLSCFTSFQLPR